MALEPGRMLAHYRLVEKIGEGGMGVVWKAEDTKLGRDVALKVLPEAMAADPERLSRFGREARVLASLTHPNVAAIHGFEEEEGVRFLVLELVPGHTLAERLEPGPLDVEETVRIARQIAEGVEAAHERGIIHRDLKPANVKVTDDGTVKVLDFGLAKALAGDPASTELSQSPTITEAATREGVILGTAAYMSPEQVRGRTLDRRTDVWSFGCILFECLAGRRPFSGETVSDTLAGILKQEPDLGVLPAGLPAGLRDLLSRCLRKDARDRLRDIGDARIILSELGTSAEGTAAVVDMPTRERPKGAGLLVAAAGILAGIAIGALGVRFLDRGAAEPGAVPVHAEIPLPAGHHLKVVDNVSLAVSPDSRRIAFVARAEGIMTLFVRSLDADEARQLPATEGAAGPFFSPDGQWVAYFSYLRGALEKVPVGGGAPERICATPPSSRGGTWGRDGRIIFTRGYDSGLFIVPADGGEPTPLTELREEEKSHRFPHLLPDGNTVLFVIGTPDITSWDEATIATLALDTGEIRTVIDGGTFPQYASTGHLLYARDESVLAVPFDPQSGATRGSPVKVIDGIVTSPHQGPAQFAVSPDGTLLYAPGSVSTPQVQLVGLNRAGVLRPLGPPVRNYQRVRLSPDGRRLAVSIDSANADVWTYDLERDTLTRLTTGWDNEGPIWTPDGERLIFASNRGGVSDLYWKGVDSRAPAELLHASDRAKVPESVSRDGKWLAFVEDGEETGMDIWLLALDGSEEARPIVRGPALEAHPAFSPDGRWLAYVSDESGEAEVYVAGFPDLDRRWQVSNAGGDQPMWSPDSGSIYYREGTRLMSVTVRASSSALSIGVPGPFVTGGAPGSGELADPRSWATLIQGISQYDVSPGTEELLLLDLLDSHPPTSLRLVLHWHHDLTAAFSTTL